MSPSDPFAPLRYDMEVPSDGRIELTVPLPAGAAVSVYVLDKSHTEIDDLASAAGSSIDFWDNAEDDEDWNNA